jgi:triacylglycerol lipase
MKSTDLLLFAQLAEITYEDPATSQTKFAALGYDVVKFFNEDGAQGYLLNSECGYVLSFRGTQITELSDLFADLEAGKRTELSGGRVHHGFQKELDKLWLQIESAIANIDKLYVTGHSLGAAMATIAANRIKSKVIALVTFGSPRVGTSEFVSNCTFTHYRVQNNCDDVTKVPPALMNFRHHTDSIYMNFYGEFRQLTTWQKIKDMVRSRLRARAKRERFIGLKDHFMANYIKKLQALAVKEKGE